MKKISIEEAVKLLRDGDVVAIPTETVYGLGGWIESPEGLNKIFSTKERPFFDPLIVHVDTIVKARSLSRNWTRAHDVLAEACWPGPLTLITEKAADVNPLITAGLDSVGVRCPDHKLTLELISKLPGGVAAPSANKFGKTSPTSAEHVSAEFGEAVSILDGGASKIGIESTVAGVKEQGRGFFIEIYRPGFYTATRLQEILRASGIEAQVIYSQSPVAPGQLKHHYMPKIPLVIVPADFDWANERSGIEAALKRSFEKPIRWQQAHDAALASRELYQKMRDFDEQGFDLIITSRLPHHDSEDWKGIWNRLEKAQSYTLLRS